MNPRIVLRTGAVLALLLTYGFARMLRDTKEIKLMSLATPTERAAAGLVSFPIAISKEENVQASPRSLRGNG